MIGLPLQLLGPEDRSFNTGAAVVPLSVIEPNPSATAEADAEPAAHHRFETDLAVEAVFYRQVPQALVHSLGAAAVDPGAFGRACIFPEFYEEVCNKTVEDLASIVGRHVGFDG